MQESPPSKDFQQLHQKDTMIQLDEVNTAFLSLLSMTKARV